ncbi:MAG: 4Fe-4S dicluster domain-containing protein [Candidatus Heimdallarchaeota archaeon]
MLSKIIARQDLPKLVDALVNDFIVVAPTYEKKVPTLTEVKSSDEVAMNILFEEKLPMLPPKKLFLPAEQTVFRYSLKDGITEGCDALENQLEKDIILFGISPCDISGISVQERVFRDNYKDELFLKMRDKTIIIGMNCLKPCYEYCFCETMGSNDPKSGYDIMLTEISGKQLIAVPNSDKGKVILRKYPDIFTEVTKKEVSAYNKTLQGKRDTFTEQFLVEGLASQIEDNIESKVWEEFTEKCLFCGSCTFVCPTCYCYSVKDKIDVKLQEGERIRQWDSCYYPEFALVAGPHNFRERHDQRFRYRYLHKFVDIPRRYNLEGCIGCGRCVAYCPTQIDVRDVLRKIRGESK